MGIDIDAVTGILVEAALQDILPRFQTLKTHEVKEKKSGELVTVADIAAEKRITRRLLDLLPGSHVVGEEAVAGDPGILDKLADPDPIWPDPIWIVDPIDGTGNFAAGRPVFAVMVALVRNGEAVAAWIHDPLNDRTATAERGAGAWLGRERLKVAPAGRPDEMRGTLHAGTFAPPDMVRRVQAHRHKVGTIRSLRCAGHEYLRLASGAVHFSLFTKLMPWDHVPGTLIQREAGGIARTLDGAPYTARSHRAPGLLIAPDEDSWQALRQALFGTPEAA